VGLLDEEAIDASVISEATSSAGHGSRGLLLVGSAKLLTVNIE
jgi:hypothetical protein